MAKPDITKRERFTTLSPTVDDDQYTSSVGANPSFDTVPPDPMGFIPKEEKKNGKA